MENQAAGGDSGQDELVSSQSDCSDSFQLPDDMDFLDLNTLSAVNENEVIRATRINERKQVQLLLSLS